MTIIVDIIFITNTMGMVVNITGCGQLAPKAKLAPNIIIANA